MSVNIYIIPPPGLPDPQEPISSFANVPGNIMTAPEVIGCARLDDIPAVNTASSAHVQVLTQLIAELDKGNEGKFSDQWCVDTDLRWSSGREMREAWHQIASYMPWTGKYESERTYWGCLKRDQLRKDAMRFLLYYLAGYEIRWSP